MSVHASHDVGALAGVDLSAEKWVREARRRRELQAHADDVGDTVDRLTRRCSWLERKAARLPLRSNARAKSTGEAHTCRLLQALLTRALEGQATPQVTVTGGGQVRAAAELLRTLQAA